MEKERSKLIFKFYRLLREEYEVVADNIVEAKKQLQEADDLRQYQVGLFHTDDEEFHPF